MHVNRRLLTAAALVVLVFGTVGCILAVDGDPDQVRRVTLYLPNCTGHWLETHEHAVADSGGAAYEMILHGWLQEVGCLPPVEADVRVSDGVARVSFSSCVTEMDCEYEGLLVKSLVNSLTQLQDISSVWILVDGEESYTLAGRSYIGEALYRDESLIAREDFRPFAPSDPRRGERFVEGRVTAVDSDDHALRIVPSDAPVDPEGSRVKVAKEAVIHRQLPSDEHIEIGLAEVEEGDIVGVILTAEGTARGVLVVAE